MTRTSIRKFGSVTILAFASAGVLNACGRTPFHCATSTQCDSDGHSTCMLDQQCAHPSGSCSGGWAYNASASSPNVCVPQNLVPGASDGGDVIGPDAPPVDAGDGGPDAIQPDVPTDVPPGSCGVPQMLSPLSRERLTSNRPVLRWRGSGATTSYRIQTSRDAMIWSTPQAITETRFEPASAYAAGVWFWRVSAVCEDGSTSSYSSPWSFVLPHREAMTALPNRRLPGSMDVDGDGVADYAVSEPGAGKVRIYFGGTAGNSVLMNSAPFGAVIANAGDLNGDGLTDLAIGSCSSVDISPSVGTCANTFRVAYGRTDRSIVAGPVVLPPASVNGTGFGGVLEGIGDIDGDGYGDLAVGTAAIGSSDAGTVLIYHGSAAGLQGMPAETITNPGAEIRFGASIAALGDVNGDDLSDYAVGAVGVVYLVAGGTSAALPQLRSASAGFGVALSSAGDMNRDGVPDIAVGNDATFEVVVFPGIATGSINMTPMGNVPSIDAGDGTGLAIAGSGDADADGYDDLLVGSRSAGTNYEGAARLILGSGAGSVTLSPSSTQRLRFGASVAFLGNTIGPSGTTGEGDGVIVGVPGIGGTGAAVIGQAILYFWRSGTLTRDAILVAPTATATSGYGVSVAERDPFSLMTRLLASALITPSLR